MRKPSTFLKFDTIKGYSQAKNFKDRIMCNTVNFRIFKQAPKGGDFRAGGKPVSGPLTFTKRQDAASALLYKQACEGAAENTCFDVTKRSQGKAVGAIQVASINCLITTYSVSIHADTPVESYGMVYSSLGLTVNIIAEDGKITSKKHYEFTNQNFALGSE
ncbi:MAG: type VI secretion system tube protein Hcp [Psychromonas sp.]|nr:type VI secretion system tube protein Hcp [Psychromonas sp.]